MNKNVEKKIRKGGLVKLNAGCVAELANRFMLEPAGTEYLTGQSKPTHVDADRWAKERREAIAEAHAAGEDAWHITMNDAGESRLPPTSVNVKIYPSQVYQVLRARVVGHWNYHRHPGQCLVLDVNTGREVYVPRSFVEAV
jgi:hypothetical protein